MLVLYILSTVRPGFQLLRLRALFFGIPLLFLDLTLPPASPPISPGLQKFLLAFSRSRASRGVLNRPLDTKHSIKKRPRKTWRHTVRGVQKLNSEFLNRPLDTKLDHETSSQDIAPSQITTIGTRKQNS